MARKLHILSMKDKIYVINNNYSIQKELIRKSIHMSIAFLPIISAYNYYASVILLSGGLVTYFIAEILRLNGFELGLITKITIMSSRERDKGITLGPITLALGALGTLLYFNNPAFSCGIFALAFGDGLSSVTGKLWGTIKIPFTGGKSVVGSFTCFTMILSTSYGVTGDLIKSFSAAVIGTIVELVPIKDLDNILLPLSVALVISF